MRFDYHIKYDKKACIILNYFNFVKNLTVFIKFDFQPNIKIHFYFFYPKMQRKMQHFFYFLYHLTNVQYALSKQVYELTFQDIFIGLLL
jgi:hypothetical protein